MNEPQPMQRRRWYQPGPRTVALLVCGIGLGWFGWKLAKTRREQAVVTQIESWGGKVYYHRTSLPDWMARPFRKVQIVDLRNTQVTDAGLAQLKRLTNLKTLGLSWTQVTDAGLVHLEELTGLESLGLSWTRVTDAGLVHLKELPNLDTLWLKNTRVTDAGLVHLL